MAEPLEILGQIRGVEVIAAGRGVKSRQSLNRQFGVGRWRKMKGVAVIRWLDGAVCEAEIHWYEAHGIGRVLYKRKRILRWL
jgi:hypothetical protein